MPAKTHIPPLTSCKTPNNPVHTASSLYTVFCFGPGLETSLGGLRAKTRMTKKSTKIAANVGGLRGWMRMVPKVVRAMAVYVIPIEV
jgi:hypothetical protein